MSARSERVLRVIDLREYARLLGYPWGKALEGDALLRAEEAIDWYRRNGKPRVYLRDLGDEVVAAITAGSEVEEEIAKLWQSDRVDEAYFLDRLAAGVVERIASELGPHRSPGYAGFPLEEQHALFAHVAPLSPEIEILPSGMLKPKNSLLGIFSLDERAARNPCTSCGLPRCSFRRIAA
jgi:hypothetical protein